ncbi:MAG: hypothetical protein LC667_02660 [Thioalkalivibrio sp.]|nr:hypothetical protein [Thioalkalivibrio sp.]
MITYAAFSECPVSESEFKESPDGIYTREWNTTNHEDPLKHITLNQDRTALVLEEGVYRLTGFSSLTMMANVYPVIDTYNAYPGCCYVYDAAKWPVLPSPHGAGFDEFMTDLFAIGSIAVAMYSGLSLFECIIKVRGVPANVSVAHQCGYVSAKAMNKVYVRVGGGDSLYHQTAKISIYQIE